MKISAGNLYIIVSGRYIISGDTENLYTNKAEAEAFCIEHSVKSVQYRVVALDDYISQQVMDARQDGYNDGVDFATAYQD